MSANDEDQPFWRTKTLEEMTQAEWESLCDRCARCCLIKLEDEDDGEVHLTRLACELLDIGACRCGDYANRHELMPDCLRIDVERVRRLAWLPRTCAYRRLHEGRDLAWWHPSVSGTPETVHQAGISVRDWAISEKARPQGPIIASSSTTLTTRDGIEAWCAGRAISAAQS